MRGTASIHRRFFAPKRYFTEREIEFYLNVDFVNHIALVAELKAHPRVRFLTGYTAVDLLTPENLQRAYGSHLTVLNAAEGVIALSDTCCDGDGHDHD